MKRTTMIALGAVAALASASGWATTPAPASSAAPAASATSALPARLTAINQYQHDLVSVLALRTDAQHLLGAALLARPLHDKRKFLGFHALISRAAKADNANPAVSWAQLSDCAKGHCPNPEALDALSKHDADNAAVWLLRMDLAVRDNDASAARVNLLKAAAATRYDDYAGATLQALVAAATSLPVPATTLKSYAADTHAGAASVQAFLAFSLANAHPRPSLIPASHWCDPEHAPAAAGDIHATCLKLAHTLVWGSSPQARAAGLHLRSVLSANPATQQTARDATHDLAWQLRQYSALALKAMNNESLATQMLKLGNNGGTEMSLITAMLRQNDIALQAPDTEATTPPAASSSTPATATQAEPTPAR